MQFVTELQPVKLHINSEVIKSNYDLDTLPEAAPLTGSELLLVEQGNKDKQITVDSFVEQTTEQLDYISTIEVNGVEIPAADRTVDITMPTKLSDLQNDLGVVTDRNYNHTDNNFTTPLKTKLETVDVAAEPNVQSDWSVTNVGSDAYIMNKPSINGNRLLAGNNTADSLGLAQVFERDGQKYLKLGNTEISESQLYDLLQLLN